MEVEIGILFQLPLVCLLPASQPCYLQQHLKVHKPRPVIKPHRIITQMSTIPSRDNYYALASNLSAGFCSDVEFLGRELPSLFPALGRLGTNKKTKRKRKFEEGLRQGIRTKASNY